MKSYDILKHEIIWARVCDNCEHDLHHHGAVFIFGNHEFCDVDCFDGWNIARERTLLNG